MFNLRISTLISLTYQTGYNQLCFRADICRRRFSFNWVLKTRTRKPRWARVYRPLRHPRSTQTVLKCVEIIIVWLHTRRVRKKRVCNWIKATTYIFSRWGDLASSTCGLRKCRSVMTTKRKLRLTCERHLQLICLFMLVSVKRKCFVCVTKSYDRW